jgi:hypothetical protein
MSVVEELVLSGLNSGAWHVYCIHKVCFLYLGVSRRNEFVGFKKWQNFLD